MAAAWSRGPNRPGLGLGSGTDRAAQADALAIGPRSAGGTEVRMRFSLVSNNCIGTAQTQPGAFQRRPSHHGDPPLRPRVRSLRALAGFVALLDNHVAGLLLDHRLHGRHPHGRGPSRSAAGRRERARTRPSSGAGAGLQPSRAHSQRKADPGVVLARPLATLDPLVDIAEDDPRLRARRRRPCSSIADLHGSAALGGLVQRSDRPRLAERVPRVPAAAALRPGWPVRSSRPRACRS